ncbi:lipopolysaccharide transport periplasmic protein LptA [Sulfurospirillum sp. T05]|uniref:Lipopolysaccharide transport periplasmic protein LptA n=1 Tax=Sulfurospirillum tamanense TaxID=2813362 RepID=A0ABS2WSV2_9BACT|nr:LptA/OstA family protein [Sulfurospirillum tamanensis]MBN2964742.1 lipopolysaccharide transport periplasmic protein LptA [Sulfurospirillum tamanensis]
MRIIVAMMLSFGLMLAEQVEVVAERFNASEAAQKAVFTGNVKVTKGTDVLTSDVLTITFNAKKEPLMYEATGNAKANITMNEVRYFASGKVLTYDPVALVYTVQENGFLHEIETDRKVYGERITVNQATGSYAVDSKPSEPVKFIFQMNNQKESAQ